jgi:hypothetical protein
VGFGQGEDEMQFDAVPGVGDHKMDVVVAL